ncbi:MAG: PAS domain-containing sensor histidine kinase [Dehalococcoidia bacterium]
MVEKGTRYLKSFIGLKHILRSMMTRSRRELIIVFIVTLLFFAVATGVNYDRTVEVDQISVALVVMVIGLFWYIYRRTRDLQSEIELRKASEENLYKSEERYRALFDRSLECVYIHDFKGNYIDANDVGLDLLGYSRDEMAYLSYQDVIDPDSVYFARQVIKEIARKGYQENLAEFRLRRKNGDYVYLETQASVIFQSGRPYAIQTIGRDITARKQLQERISRYSRELEEQFEALQAAYDKLQELDKIKDDLLSTVSHELRTPLSSIKSFTEILLTYDNDEETEREFLLVINEQIDRLTHLINDFLDLAKIESGRIQWEVAEVEIAEIIKTALAGYQAQAVNMGLRLESQIEPKLPVVWADRQRIMQVITNLISNAAKFTPSGGRITVTAGSVNGSNPAYEPEMIKISVADTGMGINSADQGAIFDKFSQVGDTLRSKPPGTGLGLSICKRIVEHYGGTIWVVSEPGKGSTFLFTLPVRVGIDPK